ncbi:MAG: hypothetical protein HPM95_04945 [Alphaproteobacteria bacterium]|nr:hypothetical protein [Alphaproteobacteria bacterium]
MRADTYDLWLRAVFAIVIAALVFNCFLAFVNTRVTGISASHVMLVEVLLIGVGFLLALDRRVDLYVVLTIYLTYMALILAMRPELDLKGIRDGLIPICFYFLGRGVRDIRSVDKLVIACAGIVIAVGLFEYFLLDIFLANININDYYIARGTINAGDNFTEGSDLFISGLRPEGRNFFPFLGIHRVSSVFLEPVSMGNFGAFLGMWALFRKDMARRKLLFAASATVIILGDARFGLFVCFAFSPPSWSIASCPASSGGWYRRCSRCCWCSTVCRPPRSAGKTTSADAGSIPRVSFSSSISPACSAFPGWRRFSTTAAMPIRCTSSA